MGRRKPSWVVIVAAVLLVAWGAIQSRGVIPVFGNSAAADEYDEAYALLSKALHTADEGRRDELLEQSLGALSEVLETHPEDVSTYINRGNVYAELGRYPEAIADYDTALRLDPEALDALKNRGLTFEQSGRYEEALRDYESFLARIKTMEDERRRAEFVEFSERVRVLRILLSSEQGRAG